MPQENTTEEDLRGCGKAPGEVRRQRHDRALPDTQLIGDEGYI